MMAYLRGYENLTEASDNESLFDMSTIIRFVNNTWIEQKTRAAINIPIDVMSG